MLTLSFTMGPKLWLELGHTHGPRGEDREEAAGRMAHVNRQEEESLLKQLRERRLPKCPRCGESLGVTSVPPRADVAYVRDRLLLTCHPCGLKVALDREKG